MSDPLGYVFAAILYILKIVGPVFYNYLNPVVLEAIFLGGGGCTIPLYLLFKEMS